MTVQEKESRASAEKLQPVFYLRLGKGIHILEAPGFFSNRETDLGPLPQLPGGLSCIVLL